MVSPADHSVDPVRASLHAAYFGSDYQAVTSSKRFGVMGTQASLSVVGGPEGLIDELERMLHELDAAWSRFRDDSELMQLNHHHGAPMAVSERTRELIAMMIDGYLVTEGAYDPTILPALLAQGYTSSLVTPELTTHLPKNTATRGNPRGIQMDATTITLPPGTTLDSGGVGKGLAADMVAQHALSRGALGVLVDVGGDIKTLGDSPRGDAWRIRIEDPRDPANTLSTIELSGRGIATSTSLKRRFEVDGEPTHHLIDPQTMASTHSDTLQASVVATSAARAEIFTKVAFVHSHESLFRLASRHGFDAACLLTTGEFRATKGWPSADA